MEIKTLIRFLTAAEKLKCNTRHSWTSSGRHESVAEHSWRLTLMAYLIKDEFADADMNKVINMCLFHDLGEAVTGDIPAFLKIETDEAVEKGAVIQLLSQLPLAFQEELEELFAEMNEQKTEEAKIYKALDKMETLIQHNEADISTWLPLEYEQNLSYGEKEVSFSHYFKELKEEIRQVSLRKIKEGKGSAAE